MRNEIENEEKVNLFGNNALVPEGWYVAARSKDLAMNAAIRVPMLGAEFVVLRDHKNGVAVMRNQCAHMGAPLSHGKVKNGCVVCPFHAFTYDFSGNCIKMPADRDLSKNYKIQSFPVEEKWGQIWFYYGRSPAYKLDVFSIVDDMTYFHFPRGRFKPHFHAMVPNAMDLTHFRIVHGMTLEDYQIQQGDHYVAAQMKFLVEKDAPFIFKALGYKNLEIHFTTYGGNNYLVELKSPAKFSLLTSYCQHNLGGTWSASVVSFPKFSFFKKWTGIGFIEAAIKMKAISDFFADDEKWINFIKFKPRFIPSDRHYLAYKDLCNRQKSGGKFEISTDLEMKYYK